ncbi:MAG TPA: FtsX-like permease family protein, partial [Ktedonobacterales bacterium]|nr:FtsX-like permease family protein [Ktedonobacterales bacterium]
GMLAGLGLGILLVALVSPVIAKIGFPLKVAVTPQSVITAFGLGLLVTLVTIWIAAWAVSRMTVAAALRDLPEPPTPQPSFLALARAALALPSRQSPTRAPRPQAVLAAWTALAWALVARGFAPVALGWWLVRRGRQSGDALFFSLGLSLLATGVALLLRWLYLALLATLLRVGHAPDRALRLVRANRLIGRFTAVLIGAALALYWSLPFDAVKRWGFARFSGNGVETFFIAGVMMVFGTVWALAPNLDLLLAPVSWLLGRLGRLRHITRVALIYPAHHRYRTGIGLSLFSLVCFTMVVMACIASSTTHSYDNIPAQASGYDVAGQPLFAPVGGVGPVTAALKNGSSGTASALSAVSAATPLPLGILQSNAANARWQVYPTSEVSGAFLDGVGLPLAARASGYTSDAAVWQAVRDHPGDVVIDAGALSADDANALGVVAPPDLSPQQFIGPPIASGLPGLSSLEALNGASGQAGSLQQRQTALGPLAAFAAASQDPYILDQVTLRLNGVATGPGQIAPTALWAADLRGGKPERLTVVGIVDNSRGQRYGMFGSPQTFAPVEKGLAPFGNEYYYFKLKPGADAHAAALQIGSTLLNYGFETTVIQDILLDVNGPRVFISRVLVGLVGLTLLVGMAALAVTGSRAVVERRQQIGMLRALGFHRLHVQAIFLIESLLVGAFGTAIGLALGLVLCRNVFAVNFFASLQSNLTLVVPWPELWAICGASLLASTIASLLPAWQAGRVSPADALRYE